MTDAPNDPATPRNPDAADGPELPGQDVRPAGSHRAGLARRRQRQRRAGWVLITVSLLVIATASWVGITGLKARHDLNGVAGQLDSLRDQLTNGDFDAAARTARAVAKRAESAHGLTTGPAWWTSSKVPGFGDPVQTVRGIASAANQLADDVLPQVIAATRALSSDEVVRSAGDIDVAGMTALGRRAGSIRDRAKQLQSVIDGLPTRTWLKSADDARRKLASAMSGLVGGLEDLATAAQLTPALLGQDGPKRYFVGVVNSAELRGLGGVPGSFAILIADHGKMTFSHFGSDEELKTTTADVDLGVEYTNRYRDYLPTQVYVNSAVSPHFPDAAQIWAALWQKRTGEKLDGAIALDPTALSYLLKASGPAQLADGTEISAANIVSLTQSTAYARFTTDPLARKQYLLDIAAATDRKVFGATGNTLALLRAAVHAVRERRLLLWSADAAVQKELDGTILGGTVDPTSAPYGYVVLNNFAATKLDYYLRVGIDWKRTGCGRTREVTVTVTLNNAAPKSGLSEYVTQVPAGAPGAGDNEVQLDYFGTAGGLARSVTVDGKQIATTVTTERGHPVYSQRVRLPVGTTQTVVLHLLEPPGVGAPQLPVQPLVHPTKLTVSDAAC